MKSVNINNDDKQVIAQILEAVKSIRYGYVQIVVQDGQVVQIDRTEKIRLDTHQKRN